VHIADFVTRRPIAFSCRFMGALHHTTVGRKILHPREPVNIMDFIEPHQASDRANAWHRPQPFERLWVMLLPSSHDLVLEVPDESIIVIDQSQIDVDVFLHRWIDKALGDPLTLCFGLERLP
jgi:hypothetical protein